MTQHKGPDSLSSMITKGLNRWSLQHFAKLRARLEDSIIKLSSICTKELNQGYIYGIGELRRTKKVANKGCCWRSIWVVYFLLLRIYVSRVSRFFRDLPRSWRFSSESAFRRSAVLGPIAPNNAPKDNPDFNPWRQLYCFGKRCAGSKDSVSDWDLLTGF